MVDVLDIKQIGNVEEGNIESRFLKSGLIKTDKVAVKAYYMHADEEKASENHKVGFTNLEHEILGKRLKNMQSRMGFAIISEIGDTETLYNVNMWGKDIPILLFPSLFMQTGNRFKEVPVEKEGSLYIYEMKIANFEAGEWAKYLESKRTTDDKETYLHNFAPSDLLKR